MSSRRPRMIGLFGYFGSAFIACQRHVPGSKKTSLPKRAQAVHNPKMNLKVGIIS